MKSVLISIQPKGVEKIANREKTIEVRKTAPKCEVPFKCYIYCTKQKPYLYKEANPPFELFLDSQSYRGGSYEDRFFSGKVIGEFFCEIEKFSVGSLRCDDIENLACLSYSEMIDYFYKPEELDGKTAKQGYAWHISELKIYDNPKELSEFFTPMGKRPSYMVERPPQSWQYVEVDV